jgi:putative iron-dependent peroxidase
VPDDAPDVHGYDADVVGPDGFTMPATQHDLVLWVTGGGRSVVFDATTHAVAALGGVATLVDETVAWSHHHDRDLTGFEDGTENPPLDEAPEVALVPDGEPGAGGSIAIVQKWVHDLGSFHDLDVHEQEKVFGRTKPDSEELDPLPPRAHVNRVQIEEDGEELEIFRRSTPFGTLTEHGLMFVGFSAEQSRFRKMLERILGVADGVADRLTDFSTPVGGAFYFVPALEAMRAAE